MSKQQDNKEHMTIISLCMPPQMQDRIRREAKWRGKSRSEFVRDAITAYFRALDKQGKASPL